MSFEVNVGQATPEARYVSRGVGYSVFLNRKGADLEVGRNPASRSRVGMRLVGANGSAELSGAELLPGVTNYYVGTRSGGWRTNIANYARVRQRNVYRGVDLVYYGNQRRLEYDFVVAPGADPRVIRLAFTGTSKLEIDDGGDLLLHTSAGVMRQHRPVLSGAMTWTSRSSSTRS
jgi:hypothetical protein